MYWAFRKEGRFKSIFQFSLVDSRAKFVPSPNLSSENFDERELKTEIVKKRENHEFFSFFFFFFFFICEKK